MPLPAGTIGVCAAQSWVTGLIGRRQDLTLESGTKVSHVVVAHGDGYISESVFPHGVVISKEESHAGREIEWYMPSRPFTAEEARVLRSSARMLAGRVGYDWKGIISLLFRGRNSKRSKGLYCSYYIAEQYLTVRDYDFSGLNQPYNVDLRSMVDNLKDTRDFYRVFK